MPQLQASLMCSTSALSMNIFIRCPVFQVVSPGFCDVRRIGGYAVNNAPTPSLFDVLNLRAIYEYFHSLPSVPGSTAGAQFSVSPAACPARIDPLRWAGRNGAHDS